MSTARFGKKWADVDEDEDEGLMQSPKAGATRFETAADEHGIKTVIEYTERDGRTYKVTKRVQQTVVTTWTNKSIQERKNMAKFGKAATNDAALEKHLVVRSEEDIPIEISRKQGFAYTSAKDEAEEKFYEESLAIMEGLTKEKKVWTDMNRERQEARDDAAGITGIRDIMAGDKKEGEAAAAGTPAATDGKPVAPGSTYLPPSLRGGAAAAGGKGGGKGGDMSQQQQQEASLRVTNLSDDVREGDLQDLFAQFGRLQRVYLAKDMVTFQSRGFAFVTYYTREDAQKAINKLNGHGYDNLILQVQFAKPRA
mmetsp:Transcript_56434/g.145300  ORF Transcript_56434/g.145300 Transcript_56434/m.145300 type:complete len:311 (-) Transcript_56434:586-1518(-)